MGTQTLDDMAGQDIIDTRDILERFTELDNMDGERDEEEQAEREELDEIVGEFPSSWHDGEPLVRESHFEDYARELAEEIGAISSDAQWPATCIDWTQAAEALQADYTSVDIRGYTYYGRA